MFLHLSVSHSVHRGDRVSVWCHFLSGCLVPCSFWGCLVPSSLKGEVSVQGDLPNRDCLDRNPPPYSKYPVQLEFCGHLYNPKCIFLDYVSCQFLHIMVIIFQHIATISYVYIFHKWKWIEDESVDSGNAVKNTERWKCKISEFFLIGLFFNPSQMKVMEKQSTVLEIYSSVKT